LRLICRNRIELGFNINRKKEKYKFGRTKPKPKRKTTVQPMEKKARKPPKETQEWIQVP